MTILLSLGLLLGSAADPQPTTVQAVDQTFNWDKYYARLEGFEIDSSLGESFINQWGNFHFGTEGEIYTTSTNRIWEIITLALESDDRRVVYYALCAAKHYGNPERAQALLEAAQGHLSHMKQYVIHVVSFIGDGRHVLPLTQMLRNETENQVIVTLACALGRLGGSGSEVGPIMFLAENHEDLVVRSSALMSIGRAQLNEGRYLLVNALDSDESEERFSAALGLTFFEVDESEDSPVKAKIGAMVAQDPSRYVRMACAVHMLKRYGFNRVYADVIGSALRTNGFFQASVDFMEDLSYSYYINTIRHMKTFTESEYRRRTLEALERTIQRRNQRISESGQAE